MNDAMTWIDGEPSPFCHMVVAAADGALVEVRYRNLHGARAALLEDLASPLGRLAARLWRPNPGRVPAPVDRAEFVAAIVLGHRDTGAGIAALERLGFEVRTLGSTADQTSV